MSDWEAPVRLPSRRKNTKVDCGGHRGREHKPIFKIDERRAHWGGSLECRELDRWMWEGNVRTASRTYWQCYHIVICERCQKILDHFPECPVKPNGVEHMYPADRKRWGL